MATVTTPDGKTFEEDGATALAYYRREPGYTVTEAVTTPGGDAVDNDVDEAQPPAHSASKSDWYAYAETIADDLPAYDEITHDELVERYGAEG